MRASPTQIQQLADRIVDAVIRQGFVKPKAEVAALRKRVGALIQKNFEEEEAIEEEAERLAQGHARKMVGMDMDQRKVVEMIKRKLAEDRGFSL